MPTDFVLCAHPEVDGTATLPRSALKHLPGWEPVEADAPTPHVDEGPAPVALTSPSGREQSLPQSDPDTEEL